MFPREISFLFQHLKPSQLQTDFNLKKAIVKDQLLTSLC